MTLSRTLALWCCLVLVAPVTTRPGQSVCRWCYDVSDSWGGLAYRCGRCTRIPQDLPTNMTQLGLPAFQGHGLTSGDLKLYPELTSLRLHKSLIRHIAPDALEQLPRLRMLMLTGGRLRLFPAGLPASLERLELQGNHLHDVASVKLPKLTQMDLSANRIHHISKETLHHLPSLTMLVLANNRLRHADLSHLGKLKTVVLTNNHLVTMPKLPPSVKFVRLGYNRISTLPFLELPLITELYLDNNNISSLTSESLRGMPQLNILDLSKNPLGKVESEQFQNLPHLNNVIIPNGHVIHPQPLKAQGLVGAPPQHTVKQYVWIIVVVSTFTFILTVVTGLALICYTQRKRVFVERAKVHRVRKACSSQKLLVES